MGIQQRQYSTVLIILVVCMHLIFLFSDPFVREIHAATHFFILVGFGDSGVVLLTHADWCVGFYSVGPVISLVTNASRLASGLSGQPWWRPAVEQGEPHTFSNMYDAAGHYNTFTTALSATTIPNPLAFDV